jgi:hypothetical protein
VSSELAEHITAILSHPDVPTDLYNAVAESVNDLAGQANLTFHTPEILRVAIPLILDRLNPEQPSTEPQERPAADVAETETQSQTAIEPLTVEQAKTFVAQLLDSVDDYKSRALISLIKRLAHDPEDWHREHIAHVSARYAFVLSGAFYTEAEAFIERAVK